MDHDNTTLVPCQGSKAHIYPNFCPDRAQVRQPQYLAGVNAAVNKAFGRRLTELLDRRGMSQAMVVRRCDLSKNTVSKWCNAEVMPRQGESLREFAKALEMPWVDVLRELIPPEEYEDAKTTFDGATWPDSRPVPANVPSDKIPLVNTLSAGKRRAMTDMGYPEDWAGDWIERGVPQDARAYVVEGDSMEPELRHGDIAICAPGRDPVPGDMCVVQLGPRHGDENCARYVEVTPDGQTVLRSAKPSKYPTRYFDKHDDNRQDNDIEYAWPIVEIRRKVIVKLPKD